MDEAELELAGVYKCIQSHGGHVAVESRPEGGTTVILYLPCLGPKIEAAPGEESASETENQESA